MTGLSEKERRAIRKRAYIMTLIEAIDTLVIARKDPRDVVADLCIEFGATCRFVGGAYQLRIQGVGASCTAGHDGLLKAWQRAARRWLEKTA